MEQASERLPHACSLVQGSASGKQLTAQATPRRPPLAGCRPQPGNPWLPPPPLLAPWPPSGRHPPTPGHPLRGNRDGAAVGCAQGQASLSTHAPPLPSPSLNCQPPTLPLPGAPVSMPSFCISSSRTLGPTTPCSCARQRQGSATWALRQGEIQVIDRLAPQARLASRPACRLAKPRHLQPANHRIEIAVALLPGLKRRPGGTVL